MKHNTILFVGGLLDEERIKQVYVGCLAYIPREYMPEFHYTKMKLTPIT